MKKSIVLVMVICALGLNNAFAQTRKDAAAKPANGTQTKKAPQKTTEPAKTSDAPAKKAAPAPSEALQIFSSEQEENPYALINENHKMLASEVGQWKAILTVYTAPGSEPRNGEASCEIQSIHGGRFTTSTFLGKLGSLEFTATRTIGFDNATRKFVSTWMDNTGTGIVLCTGNYDAGKSVILLNGTFTDPQTRKEVSVRQEYYMMDESNRSLVSYVTYPGEKEFKQMEIIMKR